MNNRQYQAEMKLLSLQAIIRGVFYAVMIGTILACFVPTAMTVFGAFDRLHAALSVLPVR
jgi:uncharacterized membrane protein